MRPRVDEDEYTTVAILAPGTIRTYIPTQIPFPTQPVAFSFRSASNLCAVLREFCLRSGH
jgi:hypothetical protein